MRKTNLKPYILETAGALFARKGYGNVGINEILKAGEIARASFYHHFESKEALCAAWLESLHTRSVEHHRKLLESHKARHKIFIRDFFIELAHRIRPDGGRELGELLFLLYSGATTEAQNLRNTWPVERARKVAEQLSKKKS